MATRKEPGPDWLAIANRFAKTEHENGCTPYGVTRGPTDRSLIFFSSLPYKRWEPFRDLEIDRVRDRAAALGLRENAIALFPPSSVEKTSTYVLVFESDEAIDVPEVENSFREAVARTLDEARAERSKLPLLLRRFYETAPKDQLDVVHLEKEDVLLGFDTRHIPVSPQSHGRYERLRRRLVKRGLRLLAAKTEACGFAVLVNCSRDRVTEVRRCFEAPFLINDERLFECRVNAHFLFYECELVEDADSESEALEMAENQCPRAERAREQWNEAEKAEALGIDKYRVTVRVEIRFCDDKLVAAESDDTAIEIAEELYMKNPPLDVDGAEEVWLDTEAQEVCPVCLVPLKGADHSECG